MSARRPSAPLIGVDLASGPDASIAALRVGAKIVLMAGSDGPAQINKLWLSGFNANRKPDREALAMAFETIARAHGANVERRESKGEIGLRFTLNGAGVSLDLSGLHGGAYGLASWHNDYTTRQPARNFSQRFALAVGDGSTIRGGRLHHKATSCGADWYSLAIYVDAGLMLAARGEAFEQPSVT